jgi:hypothetical protein
MHTIEEGRTGVRPYLTSYHPAFEPGNGNSKDLGVAEEKG